LHIIHSSFYVSIDGYDNFETADDDLLLNKPTPRTRQLQKARRTLSKNSYDSSSYLDSSITKKDYLNNSNYDLKEQQYDDYIEDDNEHETGDTFVENIDDDDSMMDEDKNLIFKYRSSTQKLT
jgi:hypothetical protein